MEPATKADLKELLAEFRSEMKQSIRQSVTEAFGTWKPAFEAQASGLQVEVDLLEQHACRDKGDGAEEASSADPLDLSALKACSMEGLSRDTTQSSSAPAPTTAPPSTEGTLDGQAFGGVASTPTTCSMGCHLDTNIFVTEAVAPECSVPDQDTLFASMGDPMVELPRGVVSERIPMSPVLQGSFSLASIVKESPEDIHSASTRFITTVPVTCSTDCSPQQSTAAPTLQMKQLYYCEFIIPTSSHCIASKVSVKRPIPWPSFLDVHANGDETRPLPWPSFSVICDCEFPGDATACYVIRFSVTAFYRIFELKLLPISPTFVTLSAVIVDSGNFAALAGEYLGIDTTVCICIWLFAGCLFVVCRKSSAQLSTHYLIRQKNSHMLLLFWVWEQEELHLGFQFQLCSILPDGYLDNQSIRVRVYPDYSLKYNSLADTWRSWLLCVRSVCATVHAVVLPDGQCNRNWHSAQSAIARYALLFIIQSAVLTYVDYWWVTTVILTDMVRVFSASLHVQMEVTCSVQTKLLPARAYLLKSAGKEQIIMLAHKGNAMVPRPILVYDPMLEWRISIHSQGLLIGMMNMAYESMLVLTKFSFAGNKMTCSSNSETPRCELLGASPELMWFHVALVGGKQTFPGGRHMPESFIMTQVAPIIRRPWWINFCPLKDSLIVDTIEQSDSSYDHFCCALRDVSHWLELFVTSGSTWQLFLSGSSPSFLMARILLRATEQYGLLLYASDMGRLHCSTISSSSGSIQAGLHFFCKGTRRAPVSNSLKALQARGDSIVCNGALSAAFQEAQLHIPWDPGGSELLCSMTTAWGQAVFQGGRGVSDPFLYSTWAWAVRRWSILSWAWPSHRQRRQPTSTRRNPTRRVSKLDHEPGTAAAANTLP